MKLFEEFRRGWQGIAQPAPLFGIGFAIICLTLGTAARWGFSLIRPDLYFTPYMPAVFFAAAVAGLRAGIFAAFASGVLGLVVNFGDAHADSARVILLLIYWAVCALAIWGVEHYRSIVARERRITKASRGRWQPSQRAQGDPSRYSETPQGGAAEFVVHLDELAQQPQEICLLLRAQSAEQRLLQLVDTCCQAR